MPASGLLTIPASPCTVTVSDSDGFYSIDTLDGSSHGIWAWYRQWNGGHTPNYFRIKRKRHLNDLSYTQHILSYEGSPALSTYVYEWPSPSPPYVFEVRYSNACYLSSSKASDYAEFDTAERNANFRALSRLNAKVNPMRVNLAQVFAERHQTSRLISDTATRIVSAARSLRNGDLKGLYHSLSISSGPTVREIRRVLNTSPDKRLANHWLEYTFGWVPLLQDVYGAAETLASHALDELYHERVTASCNIPVKFVKRLDASHLVTCIGSTRVRYVVKYRLDSVSKAILSQFGLSNPSLLSWELLPYSFVVDWFIPVNTYLKNLHTFDGFEFAGGTKSTTLKGTTTTDLQGFSRAGLATLTASGKSTTFESQYARVVLGDFPDAVPPTLRNPLENGPLWKFATSWALMRQVFGK